MEGVNFDADEFKARVNGGISPEKVPFIVRWLMKAGLAKNEKQAIIIWVIFFVVVIILSIFFLYSSSTSSKKAMQDLQERVRQSEREYFLLNPPQQ